MKKTNFDNNILCRLLSIDYPIIQAGMVWASGHKLATAASNTGILGVLGSGSMSPEVFSIHLNKMEQNTRRSFAVNLPLHYSHLEEIIDLTLKSSASTVIFSSGKSEKFVEKFKSKGFKVIQVISHPSHLSFCHRSGIDAVIAEGVEAGGHNGKELLSTLSLIPLIRQNTHLPLIAAGGIIDGATMAAAFCLGADGVQMGTRFLLSEESSIHPQTKKFILSQETDRSTYLTTKSKSPIRIMLNSYGKKLKQLEESGRMTEEISHWIGKGRTKLGLFEGDTENGELEVGQGVSRINDLLPTEKIVTNILEEFSLITKRIGLLSDSTL